MTVEGRTPAEGLKLLNRKAKDLNSDGNWSEEAIELNTMILNLDPEDVSAYCRRGKCYRLRNDLERATEDYRRALELSAEESSTVPLIRQAITEIETETREQAERKRREAEEKERIEREFREELSRQQNVLSELDECDEALAVARNARVGECPDTDFAFRAYRRAVELDPSRLAVAVEWAALLRFVGHHEQARRIYERVLSLKPDHRAARVGKAAVLVDIGQADEALEMCDALLSENPEEGFARKVKARAHAARGEITEAVWHYENSGSD